LKDICQSGLYIKKCHTSRNGYIKKSLLFYAGPPQYVALFRP